MQINRVIGLMLSLALFGGCDRDSNPSSSSAPSAEAAAKASASVSDTAAKPADGAAVPEIAPNDPAAHADSVPMDAPAQNNDAAGNLPEQPDNEVEAPAADANDAETAANDAEAAANDAEAAANDVADSDTQAAGRNDADINSFDALSESQRAIVQNITWDLPPEVLNAVLKENEGGHFLFSDERHPEMFRETIENLGGTYMGIGTDQGYVFIGWQRPTLAFLVDYDPWVVVVHRIYMALFRVCDDGDCILSYFEDPEKGRAFLAETPELANRETQSIYRDAQRGITNRLRNIRRMKEKTFMNDADTYRYIKQLIEGGRLTTFQSNLLGDRAFASTRDAMQKLGAKMTVLYLSNAEQYWRYSDQFRKNMSELDYADKAFILRTIATKPVNGDYRYSAQAADLFKSWIVLPTTHTYKDFVGYTRNKDPEVFPFTLETKQPPAE